MDAREQLKRYLEQRRDMGETELVLDGLTMDACGYLYVPSYEERALFRVSPEGKVIRYFQFEPAKYGHGLEWGSGIGGWNANALYLPQPYDGNTVVEVVVGVPGGR